MLSDFDAGIGPGATLVALGATLTLLTLALGRGLAVLAWRLSRPLRGRAGLAWRFSRPLRGRAVSPWRFSRPLRGRAVAAPGVLAGVEAVETAVETAAPVPDVSPIAAMAAARSGIRRSLPFPEFAQAFVDHLRALDVFDSYVVADVLDEARWYADKHGLDLPGRDVLLSSLSEVPGVRSARTRLKLRHDLRHIELRLKQLGQSTEKPVVYFIHAHRTDQGRDAAGADSPVVRAASRAPARTEAGPGPAKAAKPRKSRTIADVRGPVAGSDDMLAGFEIAPRPMRRAA